MRKIYSSIFTGNIFKFRNRKWILGLFVVLMGMSPVNVLATDYTGSWLSVLPSASCAGAKVDYTITAKTYNDANAAIPVNGLVTITFPSGFSFNGVAAKFQGTDIVGITVSGNILSFNAPVGVAQNTSFSIVLNGVTNSSTANSYQLAMAIEATGAGNQDIFNADASSRFTINPVLSPSVSIAVDAPKTNTICAGDNVTFTATPVNGGTIPSYKWYVGATQVGTGSTFTSTTLANSDQVKVVITPDPTSCTSAATATSNVITMTVNNPVSTSVTISANPGNTICPGQSVTFSATSIINGGSNPSYQWKLNGTDVATTTTYSSSSLVTGDIVTLELTPSVACAVPATKTSNQITISLNPGTPAIPGAITGTTPVCPGI